MKIMFRNLGIALVLAIISVFVNHALGFNTVRHDIGDIARNAVTVLDESGLLLHAPDAVWQALQARQWQHALLDLRPLWAQCQLFIVGHGLLEQLSLQPHLGLTAHTLRVDLTAHAGDWDAAACAALQTRVLPSLAAGRKPYAPLPVFGIPGWHAGNAQASFYAQTQIFRPLPTQPSQAAEPAL